MNILYLAHRLPYPPNKGDKLRAFRQIEHLNRRHRVWCACFIDDPRDRVHVDALRAYCADVVAIPLNPWRARLRGLGGLIAGGTVTEAYYRSRAMRHLLQVWCHAVAFDAVVAFSSSMAPYALGTPAPRRVLDMCDRDSLKWAEYARFSRGALRALYRAEAVRLAECERRWAESFDATILITAREAVGRRTSAASPSDARVFIVGNGVDVPGDETAVRAHVDSHRVDRPANILGAIKRPTSSLNECGTGVQPVARPVENRSPMIEDRSHKGLLSVSQRAATVGFVGVMNYLPNVDGVGRFVRECWPAIRRACPAAIFRIIGRSPTRSVRRLASVAGVEVVGEVDDVQAELARIDVSVAPLRIARGLQNKVLEAMAAGKPVVLTPPVAAGLRGRHQEHYVVGDSASDLAREVIDLLRDPSRRDRMGRAARTLVRDQYRWDVELEKFERIVTGVCESAATIRRHPEMTLVDKNMSFASA